jgi:hypothetical protein
MRIFEIYSQENGHFYNYMNDAKKDTTSVFDAHNNAYDVACWMEREFGRNINKFNAKFKTKYKNFEEFKEEEDGETVAEIYEKLPKEFKEKCASWCLDELLTNDPSNAPTYLHMSLEGKRLKSDTWLCHFSDHAKQISLEGFTKGVENYQRLGLTNYLGDIEKSWGGYNFAFIATSRDARIASNYHHGSPKYGKNCVMFQSSGVPCFHYGDEETQIVFFGEHIKPQNIVYLNNDGGIWQVIAKRGNRAGEPVFHNDYFEKVVEWVIKNYQQYKGIL